MPFRELGYSSVIDLLKAVPDVVSVGFVNGTVVVRAVPKNTSAHIAKLVAGQKKAKRAAKLPRPLNNNFKQAFQSAIRSQAPHFNVANNAGHAPWNNNFIPPPARRADAPLYHVFRAMQPAAQTQRQQAAQPPKPMQSAAPAHPSKPMQSAAPAHPSKPVPTSTPAHEFRPMQPALTQAQQAQQVKPLPSVPHKPGVQKWTVVQPGPVSPALQQLSYSNHTSPTSLKGQQAKTRYFLVG